MPDEVLATAISKHVEALICLAIESWRMGRLFARVVSTMNADDSVRYANRLRFFGRTLEESLASVGLTLVNLEGQPFEPGTAATAINLEEFGPEENLMVDQMIEPVIVGSNGLVRPGSVLVRKMA